MKSIEEKVKTWIKSEKILKESITDHHVFHFSVNFPRGSPFSLSIVQPPEKRDMVAIISATQLVPEHFSRLKQLDMEKRSRMIRDLRIMLLSRPSVGFQLFFENPRDLTLQRYLIVLELYEDGINKTIFMHSLQEVHKAFLLSLEVINSYLGVPAQYLSGRTSGSSESDKFFAEYT